MQAMFEETVGRVLGYYVTPESLAAAERGEWPADLWDAITENGLAIAAAPEERGGVGGSWHDAFVLVRAAGRFVAPLPLAETILVNWLMGLAGADVAPGAATLAIGDGTLDGDRFTGTLDGVAWGRQAGHVLTAVGDGRTLVLLACADASVVPAFNTAREPRDTLVFTGARAAVVATLPAAMPTETLLLGGAMIRSAQIAGGLSHLLDTAIDYANQRVQFGRPIGKFQAIQHQLAVLAEQTALASAAAELAFASSERAPCVSGIAAAKTIASDAAGQGAAIAHAVLGAIGFTYEHSLHFTTRRLWSWRSEFGSQAFWAQRLGREMCAQGAGGYWPKLTSAMTPA
ncbi:acyl-CoA/acyl-ACP dehydrogenase [Sphingomonas sp. A2-49]|uniref:acyl-CoA dehydrogenase family protein n=1 Tax=Sphingomonas sp. A2-49 TaxID=1391375 RepID=UPI0021CF606F|nr:acyl-CoA dehydrogenase family protein [Sphingomonas sp. A2-49]MCU6453119.1 acyl-CoA/acyl-ACP dehydrogenase [Sphingomonas sp. A2-49]